jgi:hypothetical protein
MTKLLPPDNPPPISRGSLTIVEKLSRSLKENFEDWEVVNNFTPEKHALVHKETKIIIGESGRVYGEDWEVSYYPSFFEGFWFKHLIKKVVKEKLDEALYEEAPLRIRRKRLEETLRKL